MNHVNIVMDFDQLEILRASQTPGTDLNATMANAKVAAICEHSWQQRGWTVHRIKTYDDINWIEPLALVVHADVFNLSFFHKHFSDPCTLHVDGSMAAMVLDHNQVKLFKTISHSPWRINWDERPGWNERKVCEFLGLEFENYMAYAFTDGFNWCAKPLIHFTRSSMQWFQQ